MKEEQKIIKKCLKNDRAAQKLLYQQHKDRLMSIIFRYTSDISSSKDVLQETFIKIFTNLSKFDSNKGTFKSWSARIAINEYLQSKRRKNELSYEEHLPEMIGETESAMIAKLSVEELKSIIDNMPEKHRVILNLFYFESYSHQEISDLLGIKNSSSRAQLSRSKKILETLWYNLNKSAAL